MKTEIEKLIEELKKEFSSWMYLEERGWRLLADFILADRKMTVEPIKWVLNEKSHKEWPDNVIDEWQNFKIASHKILKNAGVEL